MPSVLFVVNDLMTLSSKQSSAELMALCAQRVPVWVTNTNGFAHTPDGVAVAAWRVEDTSRRGIARLRSSPWTELPLDAIGAVWIRTNPGRELRPSTAWLQMMLQVQDAGVSVRNAPSGLVRASSKLHLGTLPPGTVPRTWTSDDPQRLSHFLGQLGGLAVVKPALGTQGRGVERISPTAADRDAILERAVQNGPALLQDYLPDAVHGDVRIHVVDGRLLEVEGKACAVRRVPGPGEWRSNVALGGMPARAVLSTAQRDLVERVGPRLVAQGLWHVGLDVVGDRVVECNVFSPGGLRDASTFEGVDFTAELVRRFLDAVV